MAGDARLTIDTREFDRALVEYAAVSKKDWPTICNDKARDVAFRTIKYLPKALRASILALATKDWWPKFIASKISRGRGFSWTTGRKNKKTHVVRGNYTVDQARAVSKRLLRDRARAVSFMKSAFAKAGQDFPGAKGPRGKTSLTMARGKGRKATAGRQIAEVMVTYLTKRGTKDAKKKEKIAMQGLQKGINFVTRDMRKYIARKMQQRARQYSAR